MSVRVEGESKGAPRKSKTTGDNGVLVSRLKTLDLPFGGWRAGMEERVCPGGVGGGLDSPTTCRLV